MIVGTFSPSAVSFGSVTSKWTRSLRPSLSESVLDSTHPSLRIQSAVFALNTFCDSPLTNVGSAAAAVPVMATASAAVSTPARLTASPSLKLSRARYERRGARLIMQVSEKSVTEFVEPQLHAADELGHAARLGLAQGLAQQLAGPIGLAAGDQQLGVLAPHERHDGSQPAPRVDLE